MIGAGINGCGTALELSRRGHRVLVLDKGRVGGGTSSKSSRLIHGGLRYLETFRFGLVYEALHDRTELLETYPDLVSLKPFYLPVYDSSPRSPFMVWTGVKLYDLLAGRRNKARSSTVPIETFAETFPKFRTERIRAVYRYYDGKTNDLDLTRRVAEDAKSNGCTVLEASEVSAFAWDDRSIRLTANGTTYAAPVCVNAAGPWIDEVTERLGMPARYAIRKVSGIHIFFDGLLAPEPLFLQTDGKRIFFVIPEPERNQTMVGTTEREETAEADAVTVDEADVTYLVDALNAYLVEGERVTRAQVKEACIGIRPLVESRADPTDLSREYKLDVHSNGKATLLHIYGGKLTTYLSLSRRVADTVEKSAKR